MGLLLPCNVVYADGSESVVAINDPVAMVGADENAPLRPIADEAKTRLDTRLDRVLERLWTG